MNKQLLNTLLAALVAIHSPIFSNPANTKKTVKKQASFPAKVVQWVKDHPVETVIGLAATVVGALTFRYAWTLNTAKSSDEQDENRSNQNDLSQGKPTFSDDSESECGTYERTPPEFGVKECIGSRPSMEDRSIGGVWNENEHLEFYAVFDGHGGSSTADQAQTVVPQEIAKKYNGKNLRNAIVDGIKSADKILCKESGAGSCAVGMIVDKSKKQLNLFNLGDSRAVVEKNGNVAFETTDHKPTNKIEEERIKKNDGIVTKIKTVNGTTIGRVNGILAVSRALGDGPLKPIVSNTPDVTRYQYDDNNEFAILACDGVWDVMNSKEAVTFVKKEIDKGASLQEASDALVKEALDNGSSDNVSAIVVGLK